ncbi:hypothetical protein M9H77_13137 [Catharanthus roseus]|uniref:Uncharacterized protein n=1 Tax=Catharanthus roseus TaxID=4058 RepID=A0ACC0BJI6_CATRO|nr:hypothetical protein M9H77_13137 [Catharanthus roseus]
MVALLYELLAGEDNCEEINALSCIDRNNLNCDVFNASPCVDSDMILLESLEEVVLVIEISNEDSLVGSIVSSEEDAFRWVLVFRHFMRSQRPVTKNNVVYLQELKDSGVSIIVQIRVLKKQVGGSPFVGFTSRDAYNSLQSNNLDGGDVNSLIQIFRWTKENEEDFSFNFEVDIRTFFSGSVLSSQRSEATNYAIFRRLSKITTLCDFYRIFNKVVSEWRSNTNMEDFRCNQGHIEMKVPESKLLQYANRVYTIRAYKMLKISL